MGPPDPDDRDEAWFSALYTDFYHHILRYGVRRLPDTEAASELAQDVFVITWRRRTEVPATPLPWLYGVARRVLANRRRADTHLPVPLADVPETPVSDEPATALDLRAALATLPEPDQEILRLVGWEELSVSEAAHVLGCSRTAAGVRLHRARRRLTSALQHPPRRPPTPDRPAPPGRTAVSGRTAISGWPGADMPESWRAPEPRAARAGVNGLGNGTTRPAPLGAAVDDRGGRR
ncbi:RNA polymerase sigma factor [Catenuloplanes atrovinosus]|uniref:RNA polymerase sigma-70 factor (ECF subfamily) n=1 Tax=Catenuloplanes atrovinosus TaxID=137266 RepID=A0AAE3YQ74_9ACTN|nr:sigma-70 family RNA polymerase sigma factor [Catenuloplanes atrovinosus]MDR7275781.1 RNA polymerase sigma-70 factor (ECF subfamily) [Catenuloplanes atrovinosus]